MALAPLTYTGFAIISEIARSHAFAIVEDGLAELRILVVAPTDGVIIEKYMIWIVTAVEASTWSSFCPWLRSTWSILFALLLCNLLAVV